MPQDQPEQHTIGPFRARGSSGGELRIRPDLHHSCEPLIGIERYLVHFQAVVAFLLGSSIEALLEYREHSENLSVSIYRTWIGVTRLTVLWLGASLFATG